VIIAIDGPAAAGKGTLAKALAQRLGFHFLDTGLLYRMVGFAMLQGAEDPVAVAQTLAPETFDPTDLRNEIVAKAASEVAAIPAVRAALLDFQRNFAKQKPGSVLDGRDIGTVICPDADYKFYITASVATRAARRHQELRDQGISLAEVTADIEARDRRDAAQSAPALDAVIIDTSDLSPAECLARVLSIIKTP
jgi:CMP/dCMP kinase